MIEETVILRRMGRLLPPGCGLARRDRGETVGRRAPKFRPLALGSPVEDRARSSPRIAQRPRAYGGKNLPKTEISGQRRISADFETVLSPRSPFRRCVVGGLSDRIVADCKCTRD